jgi:hypothetical protein
MPTLQEQFAAAKQRMHAAQEEARAMVRDVFKQGATALFEAHPALESFGWTQYTPYFNDGDECVFGARSVLRPRRLDRRASSPKGGT